MVAAALQEAVSLSLDVWIWKGRLSFEGLTLYRFTCLCRRTFYRPTNWGGVGWGVIAFVTTARHDVKLRYAFVTTARHDGMLRYAFVTTARHDGRRMGWGGV